MKSNRILSLAITISFGFCAAFLNAPVMAQGGNDWVAGAGKITYSAGDVGIGLVNPQARLHIEGVAWPGDGTALSVHGFDRRGGANGILSLSNQKSWTNTLFYLRQRADNPLADILRADNISGVPVFTLKQKGWVGVGTDKPIQTLDVAGRLHLKNGVIQRGGGAITSTSDLGLYSQVPFNWIRLVTKNAPIRFFTDGGTGGTPRLSIQANGKVGIGTVSPGAFKLAVEGAARVKKMTVEDGEIKLSAGGIQRAMIRTPTTGGLDLISGGDGFADVSIAQNGFVGLGTKSPQSQLHLTSGESVELLLEADVGNAGESDQPRLTLKQDGGQVTGQLGYFEASDDLELVNRKGGARLVLMANGNLCLGTGC